jgi:N-acetylglucosaminyldiphosphoundecaprenol N-acetyl-beta-D-mannosaminyltransferase
MYLAVKLSSPGPFLYKQKRTGLGGRPFNIYKVRTMAVGADTKTRLGTRLTGSYVTPIGTVLRALKLDELPQLLNIALGDMEFVGPRPIPIALEEHLRRKITGFEMRYQVRPGLTNLGQVCIVDNALEENLVADWRTRFESDLHYLGRKSTIYDLIIIGLTVLFLFTRFKVIRPREGANSAMHESYVATSIVGTPIANLDYTGVVNQIGKWIKSKKREYICIVPVHSLIVGFWDKTHRLALRRAGLCTADGVPVVWLQRLLGYRDASRVYGPTLMLKTLELAEREGWRVVLYGGMEDRLDLLEQRLNKLFPNLMLADVISPPFREMTDEEDDAMVDRLRQARPDLVFVGLGCPKQERWMLKHVSRVPGVMLGVGAAFDFHAGAVCQAPAVLQRLGLEWAFRLAVEPRRLWKRYLTTNPTYIAIAACQLLGQFILRRRYQLTDNEAKHERNAI